MSSHIRIRPQWVCGGCGHPWPCPTRRVELIAEFRDSASARQQLLMYLGAIFLDACADRRGRPAGPLYNQILGWARTLRTADRP